MRSVDEQERFVAAKNRIYVSAQDADDVLLFALTWRLSRADFAAEPAKYPVMAISRTLGAIHATKTERSFAGPAVLVFFTVSKDGQQVTLQDMIEF